MASFPSLTLAAGVFSRTDDAFAVKARFVPRPDSAARAGIAGSIVNTIARLSAIAKIRFFILFPPLSHNAHIIANLCPSSYDIILRL